MKRLLVLSTGLSLLLLMILPACGGGTGDKTPTSTVSMTPALMPTLTATLTPTPAPGGPVKIGVLQPWSGPMAMSGQLADQTIAVVQQQLKDMGGILGGRQVVFVKGDDRGVVAEAAAQAEKLILNDNVSILTMGGISSAEEVATSNVAERLNIPFMGFAYFPSVKSTIYSACLWGAELHHGRIAGFLTDYLKPKKVAYLAYDLEDAHLTMHGTEGVSGIKDRLEAEGIDIVYEQYFPVDAQDFSSYLTKIKYVNPDVLVANLNAPGQAITINKQISELGGWGSIKYFCATEAGIVKTAINMPSAVGTYVSVMWLPGSEEPGMKAYEDAFQQKYGRVPTGEMTYFYNTFWTAIKAIELAGTDDPLKVAEALRSGNLEWDSAWGPLRIGTDGIGEVKGTVTQVQEGGTLVKVWQQQ